MKLPKIRTVADVKTALRMWSVQFMLLMSTIGSVFLYDPNLINEFKAQLPAAIQDVIPAVIWAALSIASVVIRIAAQRKLFEHWVQKHGEPPKGP